MAHMKICSRCDRTLDITEFYLNRTLGYYNSWCKTCQKAYQKERYARLSEYARIRKEYKRRQDLEKRAREYFEPVKPPDPEKGVPMSEADLELLGRLDPGEDGLEGPPN